MNTDEIARNCWAITAPFCPSLARLVREQRLDTARLAIIAAALENLNRIHPSGLAPAMDHCHALEHAAAEWLAANPTTP